MPISDAALSRELLPVLMRVQFPTADAWMGLLALLLIAAWAWAWRDEVRP